VDRFIEISSGQTQTLHLHGRYRKPQFFNTNACTLIREDMAPAVCTLFVFFWASVVDNNKIYPHTLIIVE
jgi:hypothetical protein